MLVALMRMIRLSGMIPPALTKSSIQRQTEPLQIFLRPVALYFCVQQRLKNCVRFCVFAYAFAYDSKKKGSPEAPNFN
jgi:hypothetical protein